MSLRILVSRRPGETRAAVVGDRTVIDLATDRDLAPSRAGEIHVARVRGRIAGAGAWRLELADGDEAILPEEIGAGGVQIAEGGLVAVQLMAHPAAGKRARATERLAYPGVGLIYVPSAKGDGLSHRLGDEARRRKLTATLSELARPKGGFIARRSAAEMTDDELRREASHLVTHADAVGLAAKTATAPIELQGCSGGAVFDLMRAYLAWAGAVIVDHAGTLRSLRDGLDGHLAGKCSLQPPGAAAPLLRESGAEAAFDAALDWRVQLGEGAAMAIEPTAALTAVDVDYGGASGGAKRLNRLAVTELARQLRLRNLSGAIVIDLVGQPRGAEARNLKRTLEQAVADDPLRVDVGAVSRLGLLEISRQRVHPPLHELAMQPSGPVLRTHSALLAAMRQAQEAWQMVPGRTIGLHASADLIEALKTRFAPLLGELESTTHGQIRLVPHPEWTCGRFEIVANAAAHE